MKIIIRKPEDFNWQSVSCDKDRLQLFYFRKKDRKEIEKDFNNIKGKPGIYLLFGENDEGKKLYIGQTKNFADRWAEPKSKYNDEWASFIAIFTWPNDDFDTGEQARKILESKIIKGFKELYKEKAIDVINGQSKSKIEPNPYESVELEKRYETFEYMFKLLNHPFFEIHNIETKVDEEKRAFLDNQKRVKIFLKNPKGSDATGYYYIETNKLEVLKNSKASNYTRPSSKKGAQRECPYLFRVRESDYISTQKDFYLFKEDVVFNSPSAATYIFVGGWCSLDNWKLEDTNQTLSDFLNKIKK